METFFDVVKIVNAVLQIILIVLVIILTKRYKSLREDVDFLSKYLTDKGKLDIVRNEAEIARNNIELSKRGIAVTSDQKEDDFKVQEDKSIFNLIPLLKNLIGPGYILDYSSASGQHVFKIYPVGSHCDSGFVLYQAMPFDYDQAFEDIIVGLKKCNYIK
jgi:hypothetical protein